MAIGDEQAPRIPVVDWDELYAREQADDVVISDLAFRGRWTAIVAPAKEGKSTAILGLAVNVARTGLSVLYLDSEMGRGDVLDRVDGWMELKPVDLVNLHYSDLPPKLNTLEGAAALGMAVSEYSPDLVILDGLNGVVVGAENEDTTWRDLYEFAIAPCKVRGIAVLSADNMGKDRAQGPRGSSVKLDKADAVLALERTDAGVKLVATHRRSAAYPSEQHYVIVGASEDDPPMLMTRVEASDPEGTSDLVTVLRNLGATPDISRRHAGKLLREHGLKVGTDRLRAALSLWKLTPSNPDPSGPEPADRNDKTPGPGTGPPGVTTSGHPPDRDQSSRSTEPVDSDVSGPIHPAVESVEAATREHAGWDRKTDDDGLWP